jgi:hypothetical protein
VDFRETLKTLDRMAMPATPPDKKRRHTSS